MNIIKHINSIFNSNSYIIIEDNDCWIIDIGDCQAILRIIDGLNLKGVFLTHIHYDHIYGLNELVAIRDGFGIYTNQLGMHALEDTTENLSFFHDAPLIFSSPERIVIVNDRQSISMSKGITAQAVFTPGHSPNCISWIIDKFIFTGDSYIPGIKVVTKLPGGNINDAINSIEIINTFKDKEIRPGHTV